MNVVFRVDSSVNIGTGHVMRCLTLAQQLRQFGCAVSFISTALEGNIIPIIEQSGFNTHVLPSPSSPLQEKGWEEDSKMTISWITELGKVNLLVVDQYLLDEKWEQALFPFVGEILVIDDLANRPHYCHYLLDQNYKWDVATPYMSLIPSECKMLLGPDYVLLRDEFIDLAPYVTIRPGRLSRLLVFFGGSDPTNETVKTLQAISCCDNNWHVDVIVGASNPNIEEIKRLCERFGYCLHIQVSNIATFMLKADFAVGAGGSTTWERCFMALPSLTIVVADNQREITEAVASYGATVLLGESASVKSEDIKDALLTLANDPEQVKTISIKSSQIVKRDVIASYPLPNILMKE